MVINSSKDIKGRETYRREEFYRDKSPEYCTKYVDSRSNLSDIDSDSETFTPIDRSKHDSSMEDTTSLDNRTSKFNIKYIMCIAPCLLIAVLAFGLAYYLKPKPNYESCSYKHLESMYPNVTEKVWEKLSVGIDNVIRDESKLGVYLFLHPEIEYAKNLVKAIASRSSSCFGNNMTPVEMKMEQFLDDYGQIIEVFKEIIQKTRVVLIANLNEVPAKNALALHSICDTQNPVDNNKVMIYLTLVPSSINGSAKYIAEETLLKLWGDTLGREHLDPLIARITDEVIQLGS